MKVPGVGLKYCSNTWLIISTVPAAVCSGGTVKLYSGSRIEKRGINMELPIPSFCLVSSLLITALGLISEPVAARVSTVPTGKACCILALRVKKSQASPS